MKTVTIYTDGKIRGADLWNVKPRSPLKRQPRGNDNTRRRQGDCE